MTLMMMKRIPPLEKEAQALIWKVLLGKNLRTNTDILNHWKKRETLTCNRLWRSHNLKVASPFSPYGFLSMNLKVLERLEGLSIR